MKKIFKRTIILDDIVHKNYNNCFLKINNNIKTKEGLKTKRNEKFDLYLGNNICIITSNFKLIKIIKGTDQIENFFSKDINLKDTIFTLMSENFKYYETEDFYEKLILILSEEYSLSLDDLIFKEDNVKLACLFPEKYENLILEKITRIKRKKERENYIINLTEFIIDENYACKIIDLIKTLNLKDSKRLISINYLNKKFISKMLNGDINENRELANFIEVKMKEENKETEITNIFFYVLKDTIKDHENKKRLFKLNFKKKYSKKNLSLILK